MGSIPNTVHYCCVARGKRTLYVHSEDDEEIENLAAVCLENAPPYHKWYFETIGKRTFGFLMEDGYVYFTIVDEVLGNPSVLKFLEHLRDEFRKFVRKGSRGSFSGLSSISVQEQLVPVIRQLISTLEHVSQGGSDWNFGNSSDNVGFSPSPSDVNGQIEAVNSTKDPLLGKVGKQDKKKSKEHVITMRDIELEEHRRSTDRGVKNDSSSLDSTNQGGAVLQKDLGSMRIRSSSQSIRKKWWRQVRIIVAIDIAICLILFIIWISICGGFGCTR